MEATIDKKIKSFVNDNIYILFLICITIIGMLIRGCFLEYVSKDYTIFLSKWFEYIKNNGGILALKDEIGNYNVPYYYILAFLTYLPINSLTSIKLVSIIFDIIISLISGMLVYELCKKSKYRRLFGSLTYSIVFCLPTVVLNSSAWAQCDVIYSAFALAALYFLIRKKYNMSFIMFGISFSFKLQAIFLLPIYIILYFKNEEISLKHFFVGISTYIISCMPAIILGRSIHSTFSIYLNQVGYYKRLTANFNNIYRLLPDNYDLLSKPMILLTICILGIIAMFIINYKFILTEKHIIGLSILSILICTYFLPAMHDRYIFIADVLAVVYFMIDKKKVYIPLGITTISLIPYLKYLFGFTVIDFKVAAIFNLIIIILFFKDLITDIFNHRVINNNNIKEQDNIWGI